MVPGVDKGPPGEQCPLDPCVFSYSTLGESDKSVLVRDPCGGNDTFHEALELLRKKFSLGSFEQGTFTFTGIRLHQWDDMSIEMDPREYIESVEPMSVARERRREQSQPVTEDERRRFRQLIGSLQYGTVRTRADLSAKVGEMQSVGNTATVGRLLEANRILQEARQHPVS